jgi:hypothetical protein
VLRLSKYQTRTEMAFSANWSFHYTLIGDGRNTAPVLYMYGYRKRLLRLPKFNPGPSARSCTACWPRHTTYCRTLSCLSQWQRRLQLGVPGADLSRDSNYSTEIFLSTCRYNCRQPTSPVSKLPLPRLCKSLFTTPILSELLAMSNYKEIDKFHSFPTYVTAFWGVTPCCR